MFFLYSKAGCKFFDLCAKPEVVKAAKKGLAGNEGYLCVSVGTKNDPHISKAKFAGKCSNCGKCVEVCPQNAITEAKSNPNFNKTKCIGCAKCKNICPSDAIEIESENTDLKEILPPLIELGIDCIELHATTEDEIEEKWAYLNEVFDGTLSICINNSKIDQQKLLKILKKMLAARKPYTTIIKSEGASMTGNLNDLNTTLSTIEVAKFLQKQNLPAYIMLSGGTNIKSSELAKQMGAGG